MSECSLSLIICIKIFCVAGLPPQHLYYSPPDHHPTPSPSGGPKYHENGGHTPGQDNFSEVFSLVCQEPGPPGPSRSPKVSSSYYSPGMYPPPPPMSRPVPLVRSSNDQGSSPPVASSPGQDHHMASQYDLMPGNLIPPSEHHPPPHDGKIYTFTVIH